MAERPKFQFAPQVTSFDTSVAPRATWTEGFLKSGMESIPELIGIDPSRETMRWRAENPTGAFISSLAGMAIPYLGWEATAARLPVLGSALARVGSAERLIAAPIKSRVQRELLRLSPFEAGRVGAAATFGEPENLGEVAMSAGIDLALAGGLGAAVGLYKATRTPRGPDSNLYKLQRFVPGLDLEGSRQQQLRQIRSAWDELIAKGADPQTDSVLAMLRSADARLDREIRLEFPKGPRGTQQREGRAIFPLVGGGGQEISRLWKPFTSAETSHTTRLQLVDLGSWGFGVPGAAENALKDFGLSRADVPYMQFPRYTIFKSGKPAGEMRNTVQKHLTAIGDGWYIGKEQPHGDSAGLFVMMKHLEGKSPSAAAGAPPVTDPKLDRWIGFKTDAPERFRPGQQAWVNMMAKRSDWESTYLGGMDLAWAKKNLHIYGGTQSFMEALPFEEAKGIPRGKPEILVDNVLRKMGLKPGAELLGDVGANLRAFAKEYVSPTMFQFSKSPLARWLYGVARYTFDDAQTRATRILYGDVKTSGSGTLFADVLKRPKQMGNVKGALDKLTEADLATVWRAWHEQWSPDKARAALPEMSEEAYAFLKELEHWDNYQLTQMQQTQSFVGLQEFIPSANHYMIARTWAGGWRQRIANEANELVYVASGNKAQAAETARRIIAEAENKGVKLHLIDKSPMLSNRLEDLDILKNLRVSSPGHRIANEIAVRLPGLRPKRGGPILNVGGYIGHEAPWTRDELMDIIRDHVTSRQRYIAELTVHHRLGQEMFNLGKEDASLYMQLLDRIRDLTGRPGPLSKFQNQLVDRVLAPALGPNSATKVVSVANNVMMNLQLGMGNLAFPVLNALTFLQTVLPQTAFVLTADKAMLQRYYTMFGVAGRDGRPQGGMGMLDPMKILWRSMKEMHRPDPELRTAVARGSVEGVTDPRLVEDFLGQNATRVRDLQKVMSGEEPFTRWLKAVSEFMPAQSEKLARLQSFTNGWIIGRDFMGLKDEARYQFAKEFTNNTMYLYSVADRPRVITGPMGTLFGMFKNWQMHYIGNMLQYTSEATLRGNFAPLLWMLGGTATVGGVGALPLYSVADQMSKVLTDQSLMVNLYSMLNFGGDDEELADGLFYGIPGFLGVSLQGSATAPGQDFAKDASMLFSFVQWDRMKYLGQTFGEAYNQWTTTGRHPASSPQVRDLLIRAIGPKTIFRVMQTISDSTLRSMATGYPIMNNLQLHERFLYSLGLTPTSVDKTYASMDELWRDQNKRRTAIQTLGKAWAAARAAGDSDSLYEISVNAHAQGLPLGSIIASGQAREAKAEEPIIERQFRREAVLPYKRAGLIE